MAANAVYCGGGCAPMHSIVLDTGCTRRPVPLDGTCSAGSCPVHLRLIEILGGLCWRILTLTWISGVQAGLTPERTDQAVPVDGFSAAFRSSTTANMGKYMNSTVHRPTST